MIPLAALLAFGADTSTDTRASTTAERSNARKQASAPSAPSASLPRLCAILGPTPPSAPLNLAHYAVSTGSLPPFESSLAGVAEKPTRVSALIITGPRTALHAALEDEDEPHLRTARGTGIDVRYYPTTAHARLLLTLLSAGGENGRETGRKEGALQRVYDLPARPGVLILHDLLGLFEENNENRPPGTGPFAATPAAAYLDLISAARSAAVHLNSALIVVEPRAVNLALPILPTADSVPTSAREKRVPVADGLKWLLGCVVHVREDLRDDMADGESRYVVSMEGEPDAHMWRRPVGKAQFAVYTENGETGEGAWAWEWTEPAAPPATATARPRQPTAS